MRKVIKRRIRKSSGGVNIAADVSAAIATGEGQSSHVSSSSAQRVVQRSGSKGPRKQPKEEQL